jgi:diguanylate cyclase (GGDEF)-like protein/hemerythrin-like metal-binding protein
MLHFPVALALIGADDDIEFLNEQFLQIFDPACLASSEVKKLLRRPSESWQALRLPRRDGSLADTQARAIRVQNSTMLVVDETPASASKEALEHLRGRIIELERLSSTDRLTGAWNRAHLERVIESELSRSARLRQPVALILVDIDHFKRVNDTFGHQAGDSVLRELVQTLTASIRSGDLLFRWGGEEFVVLAPSTGHRAAATLAEKLRTVVEQHAFAIVGKVTMSVGVAEHLAAESTEIWFQRVDEALYSAKGGGRNRVVVDECGSSNLWAAESGSSVLRLQWMEAYECGEPTIDREHRELFDLANATVTASLTKGSDPAPSLAALDALLAHVVRHFADEEALLAEHGYVHLDAHKRAHAGLLARAAELKASAEAGKGTLGELIEFLAVDVVARHLFKMDRDFYPLFKAMATTGERTLAA